MGKCLSPTIIGSLLIKKNKSQFFKGCHEKSCSLFLHSMNGLVVKKVI